ncbi:spore coat associated protein CotJA [Clostridium swellfunianum]|uniref:spore coat associated protein CotJA n=1 Tax=Clostridium swellfunianum TaxID=1367462 RepID=UPI00202FF6FE|nr:spore coat associated protein CotJA [Clostridium swellfunianum]MCM0649825.1 spore coat associated protein CotJA [Clostridium swellfunianum]
MAYIQKPENEMYDANANCMPKMNCIPQETVIKNVRLAAAYVPYQKMCELFRPIEALKRGTAFPELYSPFEPPYEPQAVYEAMVKKHKANMPHDCD